MRIVLLLSVVCLVAPYALANAEPDKTTWVEQHRPPAVVEGVPDAPDGSDPVETVQKLVRGLDPSRTVEDVLGSNEPQVHGDVEPNNTCGTATTWDGGFTTGSLTNPGDLDDYSRFPVARTERVSASMSPPATSDFDLWLYSPNCAALLRWSTLGTGVTDSVGPVTASVSGNYVILVDYFIGSSGQYSLTTTVSPNDGGTLADAPGSSPGSPRNTGATSGSLGRGTDDQDWYRTTVPGATRLTVTVAPDCFNALDVDLRIYDSSGALLAADPSFACPGVASVTCVNKDPLPTEVRIQIDRFGATGPSGYTMTISNAPLNLPADAGLPNCGTLLPL